jgi:hypothetical protein
MNFSKMLLLPILLFDAWGKDLEELFIAAGDATDQRDD